MASLSMGPSLRYYTVLSALGRNPAPCGTWPEETPLSRRTEGPEVLYVMGHHIAMGCCSSSLQCSLVHSDFAMKLRTNVLWVTKAGIQTIYKEALFVFLVCHFQYMIFKLHQKPRKIEEGWLVILQDLIFFMFFFSFVFFNNVKKSVGLLHLKNFLINLLLFLIVLCGIIQGDMEYFWRFEDRQFPLCIRYFFWQHLKGLVSNKSVYRYWLSLYCSSSPGSY